MRNTEYFKDKKIVIVGLARSGLACANLLFELGAQVWITDNKDSDATRQNRNSLISPEIKVELGTHTEEFVKGKDLLILSPGVVPTAQPLVWARKYSIPVISEIELAWILCPATVIAVTGANGKTTVTTLIGEILKKAGKKVFVCGNIGNPFAGEVAKMKEGDFVSLEVSSFQLETIDKFKPKVALILNFTPNHLDRYKDMQEYLTAKKRIFLNQDKSDYLVLNQNDPVLSKVASETKANVVYFSAGAGLNPNQAAVLEVGKIFGILKESIFEVFKQFKGIEHRMEHVATIRKVDFINDSKATTVDSAMWALNNIHAPVVLIAGGKHKGVDYRELLGAAEKKVREVILIGEARPIMRRAFEGHLVLDEAPTLEEAVEKAFHKALPGDSVLLSPMCSSFDMFSSYEERGRMFKKAVLALAASQK